MRASCFKRVEHPAKSLDEALAAITDGCMLVVPREVSGVPMAATRALIRRGVKRLHLVALPTSSLQADLADRRRLRRDTGNQRGQPRRVRPGAALHRGNHVGTIKMMDATCPALHAALQAAEKGVPFMPLRGLIGSDVLKYRDDWKVIDSPFGNSDPIVLLPAIKPDVALLHAPMADRFGNVWIGRQRELATMAHAAEKTIVTVEKIHDGNLLDDPVLAAGTLPGFYVESIAVAERGAWPLRLARSLRAPTPSIWRYTRAWRRRRRGVCRVSETSMSMRNGARRVSKLPRRGTARRRDRAADRRRAPCRGRQCLADPGDRGAARARARQQRAALRVAAAKPQEHNFWTDGARELFDCAGQGRIDVFFLSGGQIDGHGNVNLVIDRRLRASARCVSPARSARPISITWCRR